MKQSGLKTKKKANEHFAWDGLNIFLSLQVHKALIY